MSALWKVNTFPFLTVTSRHCQLLQLCSTCEGWIDERGVLVE